jgi:hypothetical protein
MKNFLFAGALAFAAIALLPNFGSVARADDFQTAKGERLAEIDIGYVKRVLRLTAEQERYWPPVESALRGLSRRQADAEPAGFVRRLSRRVVSIVLDSAAVERLAVSARPLVAVLDDEQKRTAMTLAQQMGLGPVLAALN